MSASGSGCPSATETLSRGTAAGIIMVNNKNSYNYNSDANLKPTNRDLALTRKRTGHIDAAANHMSHFVAAALVGLGYVFQLFNKFHESKHHRVIR